MCIHQFEIRNHFAPRLFGAQVLIGSLSLHPTDDDANENQQKASSGRSESDAKIKEASDRTRAIGNTNGGGNPIDDR